MVRRRTAKGGLRLFTLILVVAAASRVAAVEPIPVEFDELSDQAEFVVVGRVTDQEAKLNDNGTMILTHTTVEVDQVLAGEAPSTFDVVEYGGRVGNRSLHWAGQVIYEKGERVALFVCRDALGLLRTCGGHQGRMRVEAAADGSLKADGRMAGETVIGTVQELQTRIRSARRSSR